MPKQKRVVKNKKKTSSKHEIVVRVEPNNIVTPNDLAPEISGSKYMLPKTWISEKQILKMVQKTPPQHVYTRPAKGGGLWSYITGSYVVKVLNFVFGWNWDFKVIDKGREDNQIWVYGELTVKSPKGEAITKGQFGRADIKFKKNTKEMLDYGNDLKSATTDALKKCASLFGIGSDIYGKMEIKTETEKDFLEQTVNNTINNGKPTLKPGQVIGPEGQPVWLCSIGEEPMTEAEYNYSIKVYKKALCREHQKNGK